MSIFSVLEEDRFMHTVCADEQKLRWLNLATRCRPIAYNGVSTAYHHECGVDETHAAFFTVLNTPLPWL